MGAREKLNSHHIAGAIGAAGIIGLLTGSWLVAAVVGALAVGMAIHTGDIRLKGAIEPCPSFACTGPAPAYRERAWGRRGAKYRRKRGARFSGLDLARGQVVIQS